jgi:DNA-binding NarL/FixJ family response regulator
MCVMAAHRGLTLVIADDHTIVRETVKEMLEAKGFQVLGEASDGDEAVRLCQELEPDIAVLDISMPRLSGLDAARAIQMTHPNTKIIILTIHSGRPHLLESLVVGVSGYVTKRKAGSDLLEAIDAVCKGEIYVRTPSMVT